MQVIQVFNSSGLNGPEMLVIPALGKASWQTEIWSLHEARHGETNVFEEYCKAHNLMVRRIDVSSRFDVKAIWKMQSLIKAIKIPTVFHSHDAKASVYTWSALMNKSSVRYPSVVTHHGALARPDNLSRFYESIFTQGAKFFASRVLCVCNIDYDLLRQRGIPEQKLKLHYNGIDRPPLKWEQRRATQPHDIIRLAIVGRLSPEKNHKRLFDVLSRLSSHFSFPWITDVLGEGNLKSELISYTNQLGIHHRTRFQGYQNEAWKQLDQYDCVLNFSYGEGLPISLLEAGWRTTPVFASAVGGIPELCGHDGAEYFDLKESDQDISQRLARFCLNKEQRRNSATSLFNRVRSQYSQAHWLTTAEEVYKNELGLVL